VGKSVPSGISVLLSKLLGYWLWASREESFTEHALLAILGPLDQVFGEQVDVVL
jgi:hypothetical protein